MQALETLLQEQREATREAERQMNEARGHVRVCQGLGLLEPKPNP